MCDLSTRSNGATTVILGHLDQLFGLHFVHILTISKCSLLSVQLATWNQGCPFWLPGPALFYICYNLLVYTNAEKVDGLQMVAYMYVVTYKVKSAVSYQIHVWECACNATNIWRCEYISRDYCPVWYPTPLKLWAAAFGGVSKWTLWFFNHLRMYTFVMTNN